MGCGTQSTAAVGRLLIIFKIMKAVKCRRGENFGFLLLENVTNVQEGEAKGFGVCVFLFFSAFLFFKM